MVAIARDVAARSSWRVAMRRHCWRQSIGRPTELPSRYSGRTKLGSGASPASVGMTAAIRRTLR